MLMLATIAVLNGVPMPMIDAVMVHYSLTGQADNLLKRKVLLKSRGIPTASMVPPRWRLQGKKFVRFAGVMMSYLRASRRMRRHGFDD